MNIYDIAFPTAPARAARSTRKCARSPKVAVADLLDEAVALSGDDMQRVAIGRALGETAEGDA